MRIPVRHFKLQRKHRLGDPSAGLESDYLQRIQADLDDDLYTLEQRKDFRGNVSCQYRSGLAMSAAENLRNEAADLASRVEAAQE
jgi:hypothetical protein